MIFHRRTIVVVACLLIMLVIMGFALSARQFAGAVVATPTLAGSVCEENSTPVTFNANEGMSADFPCQPNRVVENVSTIIGDLAVVHYIADVGSSRYDIMYTDYSPMFRGDLNGLLRQIAVGKAKSESLDEFHVKETVSQEITLSGFPGELINATNATNAVRMQL